MTRAVFAVAALAAAFGCGSPRSASPVPKPTAFGAAIVAMGGERQTAGAGAVLGQPIVVQVNDAQGAAVAGALVRFRALGGVRFDPSAGLTGSDGQLSATVRLGNDAGLYSLLASTRDKGGKSLQATIPEIALDYRQTLGKELSEKYCSRCHNPESTAEKVSNHDNLSVSAHLFSEGAILNAMSPANLTAIVAHGGPALGKSAEMPPYAPTLSGSEIDALTAYIRAVADPPYHSEGVLYAK